MAEFIPPAYRIAYDLDDTVVKIIDLDLKTSINVPLQYRRRMNDEYYSENQTVKITSTRSGWVSLVFIFKQPIDFNSYAMFMKYSGLTGASIEFNPYTQKTSNGFNGAWEGDIPIVNSDIDNINPEYRESITSAPYSNIKAIRFNFLLSSSSSYVEIGALHLYAFRNTAAKKQFAICDSGGTEVPPEYFNFEDIYPNSEETKTFYIKNVSDKRITRIKVLLDVPTEVEVVDPPNATVMSQHKISLDNTTWKSSLDIASGGVYTTLNSGAIYGPIYFKRTSPENIEEKEYCGKIFVSGKLLQ